MDSNGRLSFISRLLHRWKGNELQAAETMTNTTQPEPNTSETTSTSQPSVRVRMLAGLGNPGKEYEQTRHNIGWLVLDAFAARHGIQLNKRQARAVTGQGQVAGSSLILCKPLTYMNDSGEAVANLARFYKLQPNQILVIYDDMDLPLGRLRLREGGSAGGHNGMKSIIQALHTTGFPRLRVGIGRPANEAIGHVLSRFDKDEQPVVLAAIDRAVDALDCTLTDGLTAAMNRFNP